MMNTQSQNLPLVARRLLLAGLLLLGTTGAAQAATSNATPSPSVAALRAKQEERIKDKREQVRENLQERAEELSSRLSRDKQEIAARITSKINALNQRLTGQYTRHLQRLAGILEKIEARAKRVASGGGNVEPVTAAVADAREHITAAQGAVNTQAKKVYEINLADAEQFGEAVRAAWQQFTSDHQALRQGALKAVREAVQVAFQSLRLAIAGLPTPTVTP